MGYESDNIWTTAEFIAFGRDVAGVVQGLLRAVAFVGRMAGRTMHARSGYRRQA